MSTCIVRVLSTLPARLLSAHDFPCILDHLMSELRLVPPRLQAYTNGLPLMPEASDPASEFPFLEDIEHSLRLLDSYLLGTWNMVDEDGAPGALEALTNPSTTTLGSDLVTLSLVSLIIGRDGYHETGQRGICLRIQLWLIHGSSSKLCRPSLSNPREPHSQVFGLVLGNCGRPQCNSGVRTSDCCIQSRRRQRGGD
jgi:hypothetical protein